MTHHYYHFPSSSSSSSSAAAAAAAAATAAAAAAAAEEEAAATATAILAAAAPATTLAAAAAITLAAAATTTTTAAAAAATAAAAAGIEDMSNIIHQQTPVRETAFCKHGLEVTGSTCFDFSVSQKIPRCWQSPMFTYACNTTQMYVSVIIRLLTALLNGNNESCVHLDYTAVDLCIQE